MANNDFSERFSSLPDKDLLAMLDKRADYVPDAIAAVISEIERRGGEQVIKSRIGALRYATPNVDETLLGQSDCKKKGLGCFAVPVYIILYVLLFVISIPFWRWLGEDVPIPAVLLPGIAVYLLGFLIRKLFKEFSPIVLLSAASLSAGLLLGGLFILNVSSSDIDFIPKQRWDIGGYLVRTQHGADVNSSINGLFNVLIGIATISVFAGAYWLIRPLLLLRRLRSRQTEQQNHNFADKLDELLRLVKQGQFGKTYELTSQYYEDFWNKKED